MMHIDEGWLQSYLDGEIAEADRTALESHLRLCATCRDELQELQRMTSEVSAALAETDMAVGIATARRQFAARRAALEGAPSAATVPLRRARQTVARGAAGRATLRVARASLLKAAALALLVVGGASAMIPGSPVRAWLAAALEQVTRPGAESEVPVEPVMPVPGTQAQDELPPAGVSIAPSGGSIDVRIGTPAPGARVRVRLTDAATATVRLSDPSGGRYRTSAGRIEVAEPGGGDIVVDLPRSVERATVEVGGRMFFQKIGTQLRTPGPVIDSEADEVTFRLR